MSSNIEVDTSAQLNTRSRTLAEFPTRFNNRWTDEYKVANNFSVHDNRNVIQDYGEYFGRGYGRRIAKSGIFRTKPEYLAHEKVDTENGYTSWNAYHYKGGQIDNFDTSRRRYPQKYIFENKPDEYGTQPYNIVSNLMRPNKPHTITRTFNSILASEHHHKQTNNPWKYSYNKQEDVYPRVKLAQIRKSCIDLSKY